MGEFSDSPALCAVCASTLPDGARFCAQCGARIGAGDPLPAAGEAPSERHVFGLPPSTLTVASSKLARAAAAARDTVRAWAEFAWVSLKSWSWAGREVVRLEYRKRRLHFEQAALIRSLGEAVFGEDDERAGSLNAEARALVVKIEECDEELRLAVAAVRRRVERERMAIAPTRIVAGGSGETSGDS